MYHLIFSAGRSPSKELTKRQKQQLENSSSIRQTKIGNKEKIVNVTSNSVYKQELYGAIVSSFINGFFISK